MIPSWWTLEAAESGMMESWHTRCARAQARMVGIDAGGCWEAAPTSAPPLRLSSFGVFFQLSRQPTSTSNVCLYRFLLPRLDDLSTKA